ncbi:unnamed protein product [Diatraea saccharalis]|uniref:Protein-L-isoaspartate O-methyltransferase domain-containing protein 1 n=1 Tax=Diatraea saccharalis TaxID=40085 RepID=A0A9N9QUA5_9NEOP|nr:unnamed protein product [Diatraea saccharalis]
MGGAVSSGRDNNELIDNLMGGNYIRTRCVERVFRALDRADYMTPEARDQAYKDLAWRNGPLHMSAPCIYSEVMEGLELRPGLSFLNVGSGTGYLSTLVGLILGSGGISHGVEVHPVVVEYANKKMSQFIENSPTLDEFDFCEPKFYYGNGLCLAPLQAPYDRVYCGAGCPDEYQNYFKQLIKVGGLLVMPLNDNLLQVRRVGETEWVSRSLLNVSFASLRVPTKDEAIDLIKLEEQTPVRLQVLCRAAVRAGMRVGLLRRHPELREPPPRHPPAKKPCPRRICIPIEDDSDVEGLNALHDLDAADGAHEMNALLSLVLSMGQNRVAGALRFDRLDSPPLDSSDEDDEDEQREDAADDGDDGDDDDGGGGPGGDAPAVPAEPTSPDRARPRPRSRACSEDGRAEARSRRGLLTFEFRDVRAGAPPSSSSAPPTPSDTTDYTDSEKPDAAPRDDPKEPDDGPGVPAEVEIYLGKSIDSGAGPSGSMEWEVEMEDEGSSDEETPGDSSGVKEEKRQKLDSGIGEENTPTGDSSPTKSDSKTDESDADLSRPSDSLTDDVDDTKVTSRRRLQKRGRYSGGARSSTSTEGSSEGAGGGAGAGAGAAACGERRRCKRRAGDAPSADARRVRLSILMKRGVKELPLPYALKKYVNLGRCFEF